MPYNAEKGYYEYDYAGQTDAERTQAAMKYYANNGLTSQLAAAVNYQKQKGYDSKPTTTIAETPKATTATNANTNQQSPVQSGTFSNTNLSNVRSNMSQPSNEYYVPYEQALKDLIASYPTYTPRSDAEIEAEAQNYANLQIDPQKTALQTALQNAIASAGNQKASINANYSTVQQTADRLLADAQTAGTKNAVARGGGRSGAVEYEVGKLSQPIMEQVTQAEAKKAAELTNVDNTLSTIQGNYDTSLQSLEAQRGALVAQQLSAIKELEYAKQTGSADRVMAATQHLAEITNARNQFDNSLLNNYANLMGEMPAGNAATASTSPTITSPMQTQTTTSSSTPASSLAGAVGLRDYFEGSGNTVGWDASTGNVTINGRVYTPAYLTQLGAQLVDGKWYIPESAMNALTKAHNTVYV